MRRCQPAVCLHLARRHAGGKVVAFGLCSSKSFVRSYREALLWRTPKRRTRSRLRSDGARGRCRSWGPPACPWRSEAAHQRLLRPRMHRCKTPDRIPSSLWVRRKSPTSAWRRSMSSTRRIPRHRWAVSSSPAGGVAAMDVAAAEEAAAARRAAVAGTAAPQPAAEAAQAAEAAAAGGEAAAAAVAAAAAGRAINGHRSAGSISATDRPLACLAPAWRAAPADRVNQLVVMARSDQGRAGQRRLVCRVTIS
jgi:nucleoid-associated protein YgaU